MEGKNSKFKKSNTKNEHQQLRNDEDQLKQ